MKKLFLFFLVCLLVGLVIYAGCVHAIQQAGKGRVYDRVNTIPAEQDGLVLGTSKHLRGGGDNPFFDYRIGAAAKLYHAGKVRHLLVSGDNHVHSYNEPADMRDALIAQGVPASAITLDYGGLRTLDSIVRAEKVFKLRRFTIISQRDHDERALLIAEHYGIDAIAFAADDVGFQYSKMSHVHEWLAEIKVVLDLFVLHTAPRFLGPAEPIH